MNAGQNWDRAPWLWLAAILLGTSYFAAVLLQWEGGAVSAWKASGVVLLALWAAVNARGHDGKLIAAVLGCGALGDWLLDTEGLVEGAGAFAIGHIVAIILYSRNRRPRLSLSQGALGLAIVPLALVIAWALARNADAMLASVAVGYAGLVALMAAAAWTSSFPRYQTGIGAMAFLASDLVIFAAEGGALDRSVTVWLVWPLYFAGQALIARGVVSQLSVRTSLSSAARPRHG